MGYSNLNPIQSYQHTWFQHSTHTSIMHETLLKCKCDAMHEHWRLFKQNQPKKFAKTLSILKNPKNFQKPQKLDKKRMKCMIDVRRKIIPEEENTLEAKDWVGKTFREREKSCLGRWKVKNYWERLEKMRENRVEALYRNLQFSMDWKVSRGIEHKSR